MELSQVLAVAIAATALIPVLGGMATDAVRRIPETDFSALRGPLATVVLCASLLRTGPTLAVTPPPSQRLEVTETPRPASTALGTTSAANRGENLEHFVQPGDSLWAIACRTLRQRSGTEPSNLAVDTYWRTIYQANRDVVGNDPNMIHPGQQLALP